MSHYIVGYHDHHLHTHEVCEYANDSYEAKMEATEDVGCGPQLIKAA